MIETVSSPPSYVIVLGMHRSGTSLVAGSLEDAGLNLGEVNNVHRSIGWETRRMRPSEA